MKEKETRTLGLAKLSTKAQVTVPQDARDAFDLKIGDKLLFLSKDGELVIRKA